MQGRIGGSSVAQCTVPRSPLLSTLHHPEHEHFFNHSRKSGVELSGGRVSHCSVCSHHAPPKSPRPATHPSSRHCHATQLHLSCSPRITIPGSVLRSSHHSPAQFFSSLTFILFSFLLIPPLSQILLLLVHVTVSFVSFPSLQHPLFTPCARSGWIDFLFTTGNAHPALLTNQQEEISTRDEPGMLVFLTASHVSLSVVCVCVCLCV